MSNTSCLWTWDELLSALEMVAALRSETDSDIAGVNGVSIDSRSCKSDDLFIALAGDPGPKFYSSSSSKGDGHDFIASAVERGVSTVLLSKLNSLSVRPDNYLQVQNTLDGLWQLGKAARTRLAPEAKVAAITGSAGKTTARGWLELLLSRQAKTHASTGSLNNHWGVPLSMSRMPRDAQYGVFEIGTNRPGEINVLSELVEPDVAVVMNVLPAHIGNFANLDAIRDEKLSICKGLKGTLVVPYELSLFGLRHRDITTFGLDEKADVSATVVYQEHYSEVTAKCCGINLEYRLNAGGEHRVLTSLAVLAALHQLGADVLQAANDMSELNPPVGRGNEHIVAGIRVIDDSYNANPVSMAYAIDALANQPGDGRKMACLGEMLELGSEAESAHHETRLKSKRLDRVLTVGEGFATSPGGWGHVEKPEGLDVILIAEQLRAGDTLLVKGSNRVFWQQNFVNELIAVLRKREVA